MKTFKLIALVAAALLLAAPCKASSTETSQDLGQVVSALTSTNGTSAGSALLGLYSQFKADKKLDLSNPTNITNLLTLYQNIKGLSGNSNTASFLSGLISGSKNLVNAGNSASVLGALASVSNLDLSSLANQAATAATNKAVSGVSSKLKGLFGNKAATTEPVAVQPAGDVSSAASLLTNLFKTL